MSDPMRPHDGPLSQEDAAAALDLLRRSYYYLVRDLERLVYNFFGFEEDDQGRDRPIPGSHSEPEDLDDACELIEIVAGLERLLGRNPDVYSEHQPWLVELIDGTITLAPPNEKRH